MSNSPSTLASMSVARTSPSPTRTAWAPAATTRPTSAPVMIPLSLTATEPGGMSGSRLREGARLVSRGWRSRLFTPPTGAPGQSARPGIRARLGNGMEISLEDTVGGRGLLALGDQADALPPAGPERRLEIPRRREAAALRL